MTVKTVSCRGSNMIRMNFVQPNRRLVLAAALTATLAELIGGRQAFMANAMENGDLHNKNIDYKAEKEERVLRRINNLKNTRPMTPNYEGHIPLYTTEKALLFAISGLRSFFHPENGLNIVQLGEATAWPIFLESMKRTMLSDPTGRRILRDRPNVTTQQLDMDHLAEYPKGSFGYQFYTWCKRENVSPDTRAPVSYIDDPLHAYIFKRYRQCHDFYHALNDMPIVIEGEITVKALEAANMGVPMATLGAVLAPLRLKPIQRERLYQTYLPWAVRTGLTCKPLINVYWEEVLSMDCNELRKELGIALPPDLRNMRAERKAKIHDLNLKYKKLKEESHDL
ncbi:similar to Saccharomyces cerevisiae YDR204W COQ4 Protein with a role in ubiquinone (Coenzyme Q) biosynthesis, possibly functioning in stabilization of Coq7p [Maudiozyma barnettii]|uniref:4-hydroxy-3-methoxy-5-polyprenylbenzoate decarboxylase n=1 Tax=Maudiozyma barnettii TaxID=61262 RepID=A0A8H2VG86_9SACH|nr:ubiquinone biosynthesis protein COQ4 [Kazachstania barnettii]CAB4255005.1 similar to Saccharomyces cerevisiae YDR204W COQ4 Protein with a role in ubiquinone (Coenzyme Q) biosynthesis, possibly functioning in stabilization of Coq7p [Kazachstania barnettii]CAD1783276.1 similar to Saccharomyces cerevisiae YDR204W COQ4 Protein with a role in ubiquinone (Coenzyme Q) biosynthesis, possibly functioning in stabilization of Coq7p [Kazachstania barnettii]